MKFELTYFDSFKNREQTIRLTGINEAKVKENFISSYDQKRYPFKSIRAIDSVYYSTNKDDYMKPKALVLKKGDM